MKVNQDYSNLFVFDIEAFKWNEVYAIGIYDGHKVNSYVSSKSVSYTNDDFIAWLLDNIPHGAVVYAHAGGRYDFLFILDYIKAAAKTKITQLSVIHGSLAMLRIKHKNKVIEFRDSYKILPASLASLTLSFDVAHKKLKMDYELGFNDPRFKDYFDNDLMGLYEVLRASGLTEKLTTASNAMNIYRKAYSKSEMGRNADKTDAFFRESYYGGRTEIFRMIGHELNYYDVNSLYPYVMKENSYPLPLKSNFSFERRLRDDRLGIYRCRVKAPDSYIPLLPL